MRDRSVSITKALGIMLMVLAHTGFSQVGDSIIAMFHMPLFFFMSGYCFNESHLEDWKGFAQTKIKRLYLPYVGYSLLFLLLHNIFVRFHFYNDSYSIHDAILRAYHIIVCMNQHDQLLGGYWFMSCLFWGLIISYLLLKSLRNSAVIGILFSLCICVLMITFSYHIPVFNILPRHFLSSAFILSGVLYKRQGWGWEQKPVMVCLIALFLVLLGVHYWNASVPVIANWKVFPYFISAIAGTLGIFAIAKVLNKTKVASVMTYIGDHTFSILTWHFLSFKLVSWMIMRIYQLPLELLSEFPIIQAYSTRGWWLVYFIIGILVPLGIHYLPTKYLSARKNHE